MLVDHRRSSSRSSYDCSWLDPLDSQLIGSLSPSGINLLTSKPIYGDQAKYEQELFSCESDLEKVCGLGAIHVEHRLYLSGKFSHADSIRAYMIILESGSVRPRAATSSTVFQLKNRIDKLCWSVHLYAGRRMPILYEAVWGASLKLHRRRMKKAAAAQI